ncbi:MAG: glycosyltransferase family 1 protein [Rhodospirillaceae bacterium]|nr:MAG: glycosyltransferase family 1 protein [Rhodospirillaceae bacterium]
MILFDTQNFLPDIGGTQLYVTGLADALAARGHDLEVFCDTARTAQRVDRLRTYSIRRFGGVRPLRRYFKGRAATGRLSVGDVRAVVVDTWKSLEHFGPRASARVLCLAHGSEFLVEPGTGKARRLIAALAKADVVAANSAFTAALVAPFVTGKTRVQVIPPGVSPPEGAVSTLRPRDRHKALHFITIARLEPRKGIDTVLRILPQLKAAHPRLVYDIAGEGNDQKRLAALVDQNGLGGTVRFHGRVTEPEKAALLRSADLFLMPNRRERNSVEGFGIVFLEAASFGVPSIAGADGGTAEAVEHGETGLIVDGNDTDAMRTTLVRLVEDDETRLTMGNAAHARFWSKFAWESAVARFESALFG